jgi:hypothetical protein
MSNNELGGYLYLFIRYVKTPKNPRIFEIKIELKIMTRADE